MIHDDDHNCEVCIYWWGLGPRSPLASGECRRHSPRPGFPLTQAFDWCGDFEVSTDSLDGRRGGDDDEEEEVPE